MFLFLPPSTSSLDYSWNVRLSRRTRSAVFFVSGPQRILFVKLGVVIGQDNSVLFAGFEHRVEACLHTMVGSFKRQYTWQVYGQVVRKMPQKLMFGNCSCWSGVMLKLPLLCFFLVASGILTLPAVKRHDAEYLPQSQLSGLFKVAPLSFCTLCTLHSF